MMNNSQGDMMSPLRVQPLKKQRSGATPSSQRAPAATPNTLAVEADEGIARRRAELRRLKEARSKYSGAKTPSTRPKVTSGREVLASNGRSPGPTAPPTTRVGRAPPPPPVNRKLEFNNNNKAPAPRAKSVPPRRPPPPPVRAKQTPNEAPAKVNGFNKTGKTSPRRPAPIDPSRLMKDVTPKLTDEEPVPVKKPAPVKQQTSDPTIMKNKKAATKTPMPIGKVSNDAAAFKSPEAVLSTDPISPPSTVRRDRIQQFREGLDTPPQSPKWSKVAPNDVSTSEPVISVTNARLEETLKKSEEERSELYKKIKELETKLVENMTNTPLTPVKDMTSLQEVMDMAKEQGEEAALKWASQQLASQEKTGGLLSPAIPSTPIGRRSVSQRTATPHPKRDLNREGGDGTENTISDEDLEKRFIGSFREAAAYVPHEYFGSSSISSNIGNDGSNELCTFYVRRPYGSPPQSEIFDLVSPTPHAAYSRKAHVSDPTTIQIAVSIPYDESVLCLFGKAGVRYRITPTGNFESYPNIGQKVFGSVSYIDDTANEQEYSLDQILEEALAVRDQYCSTMMTTALGFQQRIPQLAPAAAAQTAEKASVAEIGVNTIPTEVKIGEEKDTKVDNKPEKDTQKPKKEKVVEPIGDDDSSGAADVLTIFLGMVAKSIFGFIWWIIVGLPLAAIRTSITFILASAVIGMLYLYALNGHYVSLQQSDEAFWYASQYHANHAPGLL